MSAISTSVEGKVLGLVGCGKIGNAVMRGYATCTNPPKKIIVSPRNAGIIRLIFLFGFISFFLC
jgi:pyrroline-5-carboxylate reductase